MNGSLRLGNGLKGYNTIQHDKLDYLSYLLHILMLLATLTFVQMQSLFETGIQRVLFTAAFAW